ncbi:MAG: phosphoglycerate dehydrogenase [Clostridia bacterium]|nr:phosphoglycerate dehydrogenase [Clostridia bacterium]
MFNIKRLNNISNVVYEYLGKDNYTINANIDDSSVDAYIVRSADCHEIDFAPSVKAIARAGAGVNNIPIDRCTEEGIVVFNTPGANANAVKELVICALLMSSRNIMEGNAWVKTLKGEGDQVLKLIEKGKNQFVGPEISGKTLGVIGLGAIGALVANAAKNLGMDVIGYDPMISVESAWLLSSEVKRALTLDELLAQADYITIHIPLLPTTKNFISYHEFSKMKDGVILLNFARNGLVDKHALFEAFDENKVTKYVVDFPEDDLLDNPKVIAIPHLGASTPESEENCAKMAALELKDYLEKGSINNSVNMPKCILTDTNLHRIAVIHKNLPNMVGQMTKIIGNEHINIGEMVNKSRGSIAYTVFDLDSYADSCIIAAIENIEGVVKVREIK